MKNTLAIFCLSLLILHTGCSKNNTVVNPPTTSRTTGSISFKFDHASIPAGVVVISATLTRTDFTTITKNLNLLTDSTADISIPAIQIGTWHLKVEAKNSNGTILYSGETDVVVQENIVVQLNLTLNPVSSGTGTIYIFVTWGTSNTGQWTDYGGNPVLTKYNNPISTNGVAYSKVLYDNGIYKMWYGSYFNSAVINIWYAESQNGINWNTVGSSPVLAQGVTGTWDSYGIVPGTVIKVYNEFRMYYLGCKGPYEMLSVGLATSTDGINWNKYSAPVMQATSQYYAISLTDIVKKDSLYLGYFNYSTSRSNNSNNKIGLATSYDGINWNMYNGNPILTATLAWEGGTVFFPTLVFEDNQFKMVYSGMSTSEQFAFSMATSNDGYHFTKQSAPFFINSNTIKNYNQILYPYFKKLNNEYRIYYTGQLSSGELTINLLRILNK